jgi:hypothetical protein
MRLILAVKVARSGPFLKMIAIQGKGRRVARKLFFVCANSAGETNGGVTRSNGRGILPTGSVKMSTILMIILVLLIVGSLPTWPYSSGWGYYPAGGLGVILVVALILLLFRGSTV